jgi:hypothetical protein
MGREDMPTAYRAARTAAVTSNVEEPLTAILFGVMVSATMYMTFLHIGLGLLRATAAG